MRLIGLIDPSINSFNLGDQIVMRHIMDILTERFPDAYFIHVPAYCDMDNRIEEILHKVEFFIFCGTGPICSEVTFRWPIKRWQYDRKVIFLGIGANNYDVKISYNAKIIYESNLNKNYYHSTRDNFTKSIVYDMNQTGVLVTGCPTLWNLDTNSILGYQTDNVLFTVNSSRQNHTRDLKIIDILKEKYERIFFYAQCPNDMEYLKELQLKPDHIISSNLIAIDKFFKHQNFDYIGCRLHGGIHAMHFGHRAFIVGIDNRSMEMRKDFNLPVYWTPEDIRKAIDRPYKVILNLPQSNITKWLEQF